MAFSSIRVTHLCKRRQHIGIGVAQVYMTLFVVNLLQSLYKVHFLRGGGINSREHSYNVQGEWEIVSQSSI